MIHLLTFSCKLNHFIIANILPKFCNHQVYPQNGFSWKPFAFIMSILVYKSALSLSNIGVNRTEKFYNIGSWAQSCKTCFNHVYIDHLNCQHWPNFRSSHEIKYVSWCKTLSFSLISKIKTLLNGRLYNLFYTWPKAICAAFKKFLTINMLYCN